MMYVNKIENRIKFKIKTGYYLEFLTPETTKLLGITKSNISKDKNDENVPHLEITKVLLVHCNIVNKYYQQNPRVLYTFVPDESFGQLILDINIKNTRYFTKKFYILRPFNSEFLYIKAWFTNQNSKLLEIEDKINITLVVD